MHTSLYIHANLHITNLYQTYNYYFPVRVMVPFTGPHFEYVLGGNCNHLKLPRYLLHVFIYSLWTIAIIILIYNVDVTHFWKDVLVCTILSNIYICMSHWPPIYHVIYSPLVNTPHTCIITEFDTVGSDKSYNRTKFRKSQGHTVM